MTDGAISDLQYVRSRLEDIESLRVDPDTYDSPLVPDADYDIRKHVDVVVDDVLRFSRYGQANGLLLVKAQGKIAELEQQIESLKSAINWANPNIERIVANRDELAQALYNESYDAILLNKRLSSVLSLLDEAREYVNGFNSIWIDEALNEGNASKTKDLLARIDGALAGST